MSDSERGNDPLRFVNGLLLRAASVIHVLFRTPTHSNARNELRRQREAQLTSPTNRIRREPNMNNGRRPIPFPQWGDIGAALPNPMVNGVNNDPFLAPAPAGPLTQQLNEMDAAMANANR